MKSCREWRRQVGFTTSPNLLFGHAFRYIVCCVQPKARHVSYIIHISSRTAGHAAQQHVPFECLGIALLVSSMRSSIPDHRFDTKFWPSTPSNTCSSQKMQTVSVLPQSSRFSSSQNKTTKPATSPCSHHVATERVEEFTPFCAATWSNGALPTPSRLSEHYFYHLVTWDEKQRAYGRRTSHTGTDYVALRRRRSRLRAACLSFFPSVLGKTTPQYVIRFTSWVARVSNAAHIRFVTNDSVAIPLKVDKHGQWRELNQVG